MPVLAISFTDDDADTLAVEIKRRNALRPAEKVTRSSLVRAALRSYFAERASPNAGPAPPPTQNIRQRARSYAPSPTNSNL